jgi:hypothetical protein
MSHADDVVRLQHALWMCSWRHGEDMPCAGPSLDHLDAEALARVLGVVRRLEEAFVDTLARERFVVGDIGRTHIPVGTKLYAGGLSVISESTMKLLAELGHVRLTDADGFSAEWVHPERSYPSAAMSGNPKAGASDAVLQEAIKHAEGPDAPRK